jgi:hypothetical protein
MKESTLAELPLAETLDEQTLRLVFPEAPADLSVPKDVGSMFRARMRKLGGTKRPVLLVGIVLLVAASLVLALVGQVASGGGLGVLLLVVVIGVAVWQHSKASGEFFEHYAGARGLSASSDGYIGANVPLLSRGDERKFGRIMAGRIAGRDARLGHYTYTEISTDGEGNQTRSDSDFTVLAFTLPPEVATRFAGVYLAPKSISFGALQDKLAHDRKVELESAEFAKRYSLRVVDGQDDIALYELFSTTFVHRLATELKVYWEQRGSDILFWQKGHETEAADLDRLCLECWHVLHRYLEEYR